MRTGLLLLLVGCGPKATYVPPSLGALPPDDVPTPRESGPVAGPRAVVDQAPPGPVPEGTPGGGALPPWLAQLRAQVTRRLETCLASGPATSTGTALVTARISPEGTVREVTLVRTSGSESYDRCLVSSFQVARPTPPPPEALVDGQLVTPEMAFR